MARRYAHLFKDRIQSSRILTALYHTPRYSSLPPPPPPLLTANRSSTVTSMETPVFNPYCRTRAPPPPQPVVPRCFSFLRLFFSVYLVPSPITSTIPIVVNLSETFGKLAVIAGRWAGPVQESRMREEKRREESEKRGKCRERRRRRGRDAVGNSSLTV